MFRFTPLKIEPVQMKKNVQNIIFDLGGVLLKIDAQQTIQAFRKLGMPDLIGAGGWSYNHQVFLDMEAGKLNDAAFRDGIRELLPQPATDAEIDRAWCSMILELFPERIELLKKLAADYRIYLLSNTNAIHLRFFNALFEQDFNFPFADLFVKAYYSNEIGRRKPAQETYEYVLADAGLKAEETLFIDDSLANVEGAKKTGMNTIWLTPESDLLSFF